jgi:peptide chain release factor 2
MEYDTLITNCHKLLLDCHLAEKKAQVAAIEKESEKEDFWQQENSKAKIQLLSTLQKEIKSLENLEKLSNDLAAAIELNLTEEIAHISKNLEKVYKEAELKQYLNGKYDHLHAILSIHPGQGGTEAMDWAEMIKRMYQRYLKKKLGNIDLFQKLEAKTPALKKQYLKLKKIMLMVI